MKDLRQTPEYANYMRGLGWTVEQIAEVNYFIRKIFFFGSVIKVQRVEKPSYKVIELLSKKYHAFQVILEPLTISHQQSMINNGFRRSKDYFAPSKTLQINITQPEEKLLSGMHQKTRYNTKIAISNKLKVTSSKQIDRFANFWQDCAIKQRGMFLNQKKEIKEIFRAFGKDAHLVFVKKDKELLSAILMICTKEAAYYVYAASTKKGKQLFAPTLAVWEAIKLAKRLKRRIFDFEGIYDERFPINSWVGFSRFKKSFGGREVEYPGCYTKFRFPT